MDPSDRLLGQIALQRGTLSREQLMECARRAEREGGLRTIVEIARDLRFIDDAELSAINRDRDAHLAQKRRIPAAAAPNVAPPPAEPPANVGRVAPAAPPEPEPRESLVPEGPADTMDAVVASEPPRTSLPPKHGGIVATHARRGGSRARVAEAPSGDAGVDDRTKAPYLVRALHYAAQHGGSDLHLHAGAPITARASGRLLPFPNQQPLTPGATEKAIAQILTDEQWERLSNEGEVDFPLEIPNVGRFRANAYRQHRGIDAVFRILPLVPPRLEQLGLPATLARLVDFRTGMVLCTGPTGCGKSTTLAALVGTIVESRRDHVLTIENPVEFVYRGGQSVVTQRQVGSHTTSFARALRAALREDPDVIAITDLRDRETMSLAMTAAETGHLVLGTLHTGNAAQTIGRMINAFPAEEQGQIRATLSESLRAVVSQRLVPRASGSGRVVALELLVVTTAVANLIREEKEYQIGAIMQTGKAQGMVTLDDSLTELLKAGTIDKANARRFAENKERFK
ncbi:MAG TPA: PilT/PilU family type 4a pilus ATPase [Polyangiaceae bacterium]|nr:PilT/PilU family type 4a pilus ATPase [Polyangiaceae bacterium]